MASILVFFNRFSYVHNDAPPFAVQRTAVPRCIFHSPQSFCPVNFSHPKLSLRWTVRFLRCTILPTASNSRWIPWMEIQSPSGSSDSSYCDLDPMTLRMVESEKVTWPSVRKSVGSSPTVIKVMFFAIFDFRL
ncbi:uncharacterized protein L3040_007481 [Drepanopeziza brunnea f. sp. 'multigermtubi']|uniref:uncharacterized protein n=1 Tax=Drepanopeziza brunnea f. sp. 'multigermtubi' TaxID=698441 RepID=UPI00239DF81D|nr:hypothetical protein L3040_007481 [Drepanopeziza brunnea f. sp. 'multigermtubi']